MGRKALGLIVALITFGISGFAQDDKPRFKVYGDADTIYTTPEVMPEYPGGQASLMSYLSTVKYPAYARENDMQGIAYIQFVVNEKGVVEDVKVARSSGYGILDTASMEMVQGMKNWKPGTELGKPVKVMYVVPLKFVLHNAGSTPVRTYEKDEPKRKQKGEPKRD